MNRWKDNKNWILIWGSSLLIIGLIFYICYQSILVSSAPKKAKAIKTAQTVSVVPLSEQTGKKTKEQNNPAEKKITLKPAAVAAKALDVGDFPSPVQGKVLRGIGNYYSKALESYRFHGGIDYAEPEGTVIRATHGGKVIFAGADPVLGQRVSLDCGEGWSVTYGGLENLRVKVGDNIEKMDKIGQVGVNPGAESDKGRPQLHYEVWHNNQVQNPKSKEF